MNKQKDHWIAVGLQVENTNDDHPDICTCDPAAMGHGHISSDKWIKQSIKNAQLISCAPEMLETLQECSDLFAVWANDTLVKNESIKKLMLDVKQDIDSVIKVATGE